MLISIVFRFRTVFVSDLHLGFRGTRAEEFAAFLKRVECERLYLVGDIVDMWVLRQRWRWPATHNQVARRLLKLAKRGTRVIYVPGNHDESLRPYAGIDLAGIRIATQAVHRLADGRRLLICHGDEYDLAVQHSRLLSMIGGLGYDYLVALNRAVNSARALVGLRRWSFSQAIKRKVKGACTFISRFEDALIDEAKRRGLEARDEGACAFHLPLDRLRERPAPEADQGARGVHRAVEGHQVVVAQSADHREQPRV
ncbi:MAG: UDP-2,3-diacylglucosamine diphosphatase, partial [Phycisphaerales bacterium]